MAAEIAQISCYCLVLLLKGTLSDFLYGSACVCLAWLSSALGYDGGADESRVTGASLPIRHEPAVDSTGCVWVLMWYCTMVCSIEQQWHIFCSAFRPLTRGVTFDFPAESIKISASVGDTSDQHRPLGVPGLSRGNCTVWWWLSHVHNGHIFFLTNCLVVYRQLAQYNHDQYINIQTISMYTVHKWQIIEGRRI